MNFVNPISRGQLPTFQEGSPYAVLRDGRATGKQWSKNATTTAKSANNSNAISVLQLGKLPHLKAAISQSLQEGVFLL